VMTSTLAIAPPLTPGANTVACTGAYQPEPKLVCKTPVTGWLPKIESTVRYLGIEVDDALAIAEQVDV